ncbi:hypothetical protein C8F01DRAFT_1149859 [Mycena amicta]|nr:hypothetical protein C8F01DRAFT_1149859 [Mycena amicta]
MPPSVFRPQRLVLCRGGLDAETFARLQQLLAYFSIDVLDKVIEHGTYVLGYPSPGEEEKLGDQLRFYIISHMWFVQSLRVQCELSKRTYLMELETIGELVGTVFGFAEGFAHQDINHFRDLIHYEGGEALTTDVGPLHTHMVVPPEYRKQDPNVLNAALHGVQIVASEFLTRHSRHEKFNTDTTRHLRVHFIPRASGGTLVDWIARQINQSYKKNVLRDTTQVFIGPPTRKTCWNCNAISAESVRQGSRWLCIACKDGLRCARCKGYDDPYRRYYGQNLCRACFSRAIVDTPSSGAIQPAVSPPSFATSLALPLSTDT